MQACLVPCWGVGWGLWRAGCISQDTYLLYNIVLLLEKIEIWAFILPRNFPAVLIIFTGRGGAGNPPLPTTRGGAGNPPFPAGRVPRGTGRPSLISTLIYGFFFMSFGVYLVPNI